VGKKMKRNWSVILVAVTFLSCIVFKGHTMAPLVFPLIEGILFLTPAVLGAVAVAMLFIAFFVTGSAFRILAAAGVLLSVLVWIGFLVWSDSPGATAVLSLHFIAALLYFFISGFRSPRSFP
jgi:hypothetical protein